MWIGDNDTDSMLLCHTKVLELHRALEARGAPARPTKSREKHMFFNLSRFYGTKTADGKNWLSLLLL